VIEASPANGVAVFPSDDEFTPLWKKITGQRTSICFGKGGEIYDQIQFERSWSRKLLESVYKNFLTPTEITQMLENKDIWMDSDEVRRRVKTIQDNLINLRKKENNEKD
jgi:hypothetical protein